MKPLGGWGTDLAKKISGKLSIKIFLGIFVVLALTFTLSFTLFSVLLPRLHEQELSRQFSEFTAEVNLIFQQAAASEMSVLVSSIGAENNINITVYDGEGGIAYSHTSFNPERTEHIISGRFMFSHMATGESYSMYALASLGAVRQVTDAINSILPLAFVASLLISVAVSYAYSRRLTNPIVILSEMSKKMSGIDLSNRCNISRTDEIGVLGTNLNIMAEKLEVALSELQAANVKLQIDMERERIQEKQRSDIFTAISHELKTPITILKGELGGMIDNIGVYKDRDTYLRNAFKTTEQMEHLVREILTVSRLEIKEIRLALGELDVSSAVNDLCQKHEDLASSQNVAIVCFCEDGLFAVADKLQIQNAISNIISNAIFHSPQGEMVNVQLGKSGGMGVLTVENEGQIDEVDLENLFEPFYRGDKSRSRYTGGSGLGLYIVKRILDLHEFIYDINNVGGKVAFTVKFPLID